MSRGQCETCAALKQYYRLKLNQFLLAARSGSGWQGQTPAEEELARLKDESLQAMTELMRHAKACYGLATDEAA